MKLSTRGRYGLRALAELSAEYLSGGGVVSLAAVSAKNGISERYLEQIIIPLKKAGIVSGVRGAAGGYSLTRHPSEITVGDVLRVVEGSLSPSECLEGEKASCESASCGACAAKPVLNRLFLAVNEVVDSMTLMDLIEGDDELNVESNIF